MARGRVREGKMARRERRQGEKSTTGIRRLRPLIVFGGVVLVVLGVGAYLLWPALKPVGGGAPGAVTIQPSMAGFSPARIEARVGQPVTIRLVNKDDKYHTDGGGWHQFAIDELGLDVKVSPSSTKEFTFTPTQTGIFGFYCSVCCGGKENPYMWGTLVVGS